MSKPIPNFKSEADERAFWAENDFMDYLDGKQASAPSSRISSPRSNPFRCACPSP